MPKSKKLLIIGDSAFAEVAYELFSHDSAYEVLGFAVESAFLKKRELFGLPVVALEEAEKHFAPDQVDFYAALVYSQLNRLRTRLYKQAKSKGYRPASYVSTRAFVWRNVAIGEHVFIFEDNTVQPFVKIGSNVVLWSGNHIGHHSVVRDNVFIASQVVVSGFCDVGENCFMGVNATVANNVSIGRDCLIGAGANILKDTEPGKIYGATMTSPHERKTAREYFKVPPGD